MVKVVFLHPDLGIGGAERAIIDAALGLKSKGHSVHMVTAHHDPSHCFQETKDGTLTVTAVGDWLPRSLFGRCYALCAYLRMIYTAVYLVFFSNLQSDIIFCDQISACIPILCMSSSKILFYCHFPDMLLTKRESFLKKLYRLPIDWIEEKTTGMADRVLVNSNFTGTIFSQTFPSLRHIKPDVLYPIPNFAAFEKPLDPETEDIVPVNKDVIFLSINRYERKKNLALAISALAYLRDQGNIDGIHLIMAGGYDERVTENKEHYLELRRLADSLSLDDKITFIRSFSDSQKQTLLSRATCLIYTPDKEHFGIVPIEAMYMRCPVVAVASGGPLETVKDGETGYLCQPNPKSFGEAMQKFIADKNMHKKLGQSGRKRVEEKFSFTAFSKQLDTVINQLMSQRAGGPRFISTMWLLTILAVVGIVLVATIPIFNTS